MKHQREHTCLPREQAICRMEMRPYGGLSLFDESSWGFYSMTLALTLTPRLERHTVAPRGSLMYYENTRNGSADAPGIYELVDAPRSNSHKAFARPSWRLCGCKGFAAALGTSVVALGATIVASWSLCGALAPSAIQIMTDSGQCRASFEIMAPSMKYI